jgi:hypothetical protein
MVRSVTDKSTRATEKILIEFLDFISMTRREAGSSKQAHSKGKLFFFSSFFLSFFCGNRVFLIKLMK